MDGPIKPQTGPAGWDGGANPRPPVDVVRPETPGGPFVFACPHAGRDYPAAFTAAARLDALSLRASEDAYVDLLFAEAPVLGAPLVIARFPRAYVDANRDPWELDPAMFRERLPPWAKTRSPRVAAGLGVVPRTVGEGAEIYAAPMPLAEARRRIATCHRPYHDALELELRAARARAGAAILLDCHSMPSATSRADVVLGDRHGRSAAPGVTAMIAEGLAAIGLAVTCNTPYAGGWSTERYGAPSRGVHAVQIEVNRRLYLDEKAVAPGPSFEALRAQLSRAISGWIAAAARGDVL